VSLYQMVERGEDVIKKPHQILGSDGS
jgi:hypothetical protein